MSMLDKWKSKVSAQEEAAVKKAMAEQKQNRGQYKEVPSGTYSVVVDKLGIRETPWGDDQVSITFKITEGKYKNARLFYNGSFDDHFLHGINPTAELLDQMLDDDDLTAAMIAVILGHGPEEAGDFLADAAEMCEELAYDLDYEVKEAVSKGNTYKNRYFSILGVYDV